MSYRPDGYPSISPYLIVSDPEATIHFLVEVLGGEEIRRFPREDGGIAHAEVRIDDSIVMMGGGMAGWPAVPAHVHVYVPDVDAAYERALSHGAESVQLPVQKDDPDKRGGVKDAGGTTWWISTVVG